MTTSNPLYRTWHKHSTESSDIGLSRSMSIIHAANMSSEHSSAFSEPDYAKSSSEKRNVPWFNPSIDKYLVPEVSADSNLRQSCMIT